MNDNSGRLGHGYTQQESDMDMQTVTQIGMANDLHAMRMGRGYQGGGGGGGGGGFGASLGKLVFWIILIFMVYQFFIKPIFLTIP